jgi:sigma-B regulation protein RsbU (phosphoserine phosphatase)
MPETVPEHPGWEVATRWVPAREVAGDFFDFIDRGKGLGVVIADVVDKGMPAALFMASCRSAIRACVRHGIAPDDIVTVANRVICTDTTSGMFLSFMLVELEANSGNLSYVNAGHPPALVYRHESEVIEELPRTGMIAGVDVDASYQSRSLTMEIDDCMLLYTDGVTDIVNEEGELFGEGRFLELVNSLDCSAPADTRLTAIEEGLKAFAGSTPPTDDITLVMVRRV